VTPLSRAQEARSLALRARATRPLHEASAVGRQGRGFSAIASWLCAAARGRECREHSRAHTQAFRCMHIRVHVWAEGLTLCVWEGHVGIGGSDAVA
jgi:hypothetical protein